MSIPSTTPYTTKLRINYTQYLCNFQTFFLSCPVRHKYTSTIYMLAEKSLENVSGVQLTRNRSKDVRNENLHQSLVHHMVTVTHPFQNRLILAQSNQLCFRKSTFYFTQIAGVKKNCSKLKNDNAFMAPGGMV